MSVPWAEFLAASEGDLRRNDLHRGMAYTADPSARTLDVVADYLRGFGDRGVGAREVTEAVQRDERGVKRALQSLVADGSLRIEEQTTRGPRASKRKVYHPIEKSGMVTLSLEDSIERGLHYGTANAYGAGGGREVHPRRAPE